MTTSTPPAPLASSAWRTLPQHKFMPREDGSGSSDKRVDPKPDPVTAHPDPDPETAQSDLPLNANKSGDQQTPQYNQLKNSIIQPLQ